MATEPSPSGVDIAQLNEDQQLALQQFTSVTNQELDAAIPILQRSEWNVQIAIAKFFDGETAAVDVHSTANGESVAPPRPSRRQETLLNGFSSSRSLRSLKGLTPAPRIVPQSRNQQSSFLSFLLWPINFLYTLILQPISLFAWLFPFLNRLAPAAAPGVRDRPEDEGIELEPLSPKEMSTRFIRQFEEEYGPSQLPFYDHGYAQALDLAKNELRFLLVILLSPEHDDMASFVRETLLSPEMVELMTDPQNRLILWGGSVQDAEAYQVAEGLRCTKFPVAALIVHTPQVSSTAMSVVARIVGPTPPATCIRKLREAIIQYSPALDQVRSSRESQEAERSLRHQQNSAYERSLAQDRERARQRRETEAEKKRLEEEERTRIEASRQLEENVRRWKQWRAQRLLPEPGPEEKTSIRVSIRMLSGERVLRRFSSSAGVEELYAFVECHDLLSEDVESSEVVQKPPAGYQHSYAFQLVSPMPRAVYEGRTDRLIGDCIPRNSNLVVEPLE
ncbi:MAG: 60S ribosomal protein L17 [Watsoniomyces obsoletus]|nr:MAG: 60S ribosomal protein L17 [Watsoniomyces obsoletus]